MAKNQTPFVEKYRSPRRPKFLVSRNSQWKKRKMRNVPPPMSRMGDDCSIAAMTSGSLEKVAVRAPTGPSDGVESQTISHGSRPRTAKTANSSPQIRNQRFARSLMVERTSALMMALSMLVIVSNRTRPDTIRMMERISMNQDP